MTKYNPQRHHRRSVRLRGYDYSQPGAYFVTINVRDGECVLGDVVDGRVQLTDLGRIAQSFWAQVPVPFPHVSIDEFVVMPNHVHAIIMIHEGGRTAPLQDDTRRGGVIPLNGNDGHEGARTAPLQDDTRRGGVIPPNGNDGHEGARTAPLQDDTRRGAVIPPSDPLHSQAQQQRPTLGQIVAYYKYETTKQINDLCGNDPMPFWQRSFYDHIVRNRRALDAIREYIANNPVHWELDPDHPNNIPNGQEGTTCGI